MDLRVIWNQNQSGVELFGREVFGRRVRLVGKF